MRRPLLAALTGLAVALGTTGPASAAVGAPVADPAGVAVGAAAGPHLPPPGEDGDKVMPTLAAAQGAITAFVELAAPSALDVAERGGSEAAVQAAEDRIERLAESVVPVEAGSETTDTAPQRVSVTSNLVAGTVVRGDAEEIRRLARSRHVASVYRVIPKTVTAKSTDVVTRTLQAWQDTGRTGRGVRVGVIDAGVDYTHATFGGPGTPAAYAEAYGTDGTGPVPEGTIDRAKVVGGFDFAGPRYDAEVRDGVTDLPVPDDNPIEAPAHVGLRGHGTHVAGIGFGYGVTADGRTFRGDHSAVTDLSDWRVGPGSAPDVSLYALKVFGDTGRFTELTMAALEWASDPDDDNDFSDRLDVLNLSVGSDYTPADDPENLFVDRLADLGVLSVFSAGNSGDVTDIGAAPGSARSGLTVAWSVGDTLVHDAVEVTQSPDPALLGRHAAQAAQLYTGPDVTAPVTHLGPEVTGCEPLDPFADRIEGTIVLLSWDDDDATRECGSGPRWANAAAAGAVGVLLGSRLRTLTGALGGTPALPGAQLTAASTDALLPAIVAGGLVMRVGPSLAGGLVVPVPELGDTLSPASSRGAHGSLGIIKPDVAAPGEQISSAVAGTGTRAGSRSGSSMAAPHVAGIAALVREARPGWTPAQVKAAVMNTATHDVHLGPGRTGPVYGPARVGAGRVDALDAVRTTTLAHATDDPELVSVTFGVVPVGGRTVVRHRDVTVTNTGDAPVRYATGVDTATTTGGATLTTAPDTIEVPPGESRTVTVTLTADPATLSKDLDPTSSHLATVGGYHLPRDHVAQLSGRLVLTSGDTELRVPVQAAPRLVSELSAAPVAIGDPGAGSAPLTLTGRGVDGGGWTSFAVPQQLVATSPRLPRSHLTTSPSTVAAGDLRYVGFSSTAPQIDAAGGDPATGTIGIGIATEGEWANLGVNVLLVVDTDVDGDGTGDFTTVVEKLGPGVDVTVATTYDSRTGEPVDRHPVNGLYADVDGTVFDSSVAVVPLSLEALGITPGRTPTFSVWTWSGDYDPDPDPFGVVDEVPPFTVDPYHPEYWFDGGIPGSLLFPSAPGTLLTVHRTADPAAQPSDLLVLHTHNATPAARAQVVTVEAPVAAATTTTLAVTGELRVGSPVTVTATVEPATASGSVTFRDGDVDLATAPVVDGTASTTVRLGAGPRRLTATYVPDTRMASGSTSAPVAVVVDAASSEVALRVSNRAIAFGERTTATVEVTASGGTPDGRVQVRAGDRVLASADVVTAGRRGTAVVDLPRDLPVGAHRLTAVYTGTADVAGSTSADVPVRVTASVPEVVVSAPTWTVPRGTSPTLTVTVSGPPGAPPATGTVSVLVGLRRLPPVRLGPDGTARVVLPPVRSRATVTVLYGGDGGYRPWFEMRRLDVR